jgi:serine protease Do
MHGFWAPLHPSAETGPYVVTNHHVVENATEVAVTLDDGKTVPATIVGADKKTDLALLKIKQGGPYQTAPAASLRSPNRR